MKRDLPTIERLREVFEYDPDVGSIRYRVKLNRRLKVGALVGSANNGYLRTSLDGCEVMMHRLVWAIYHGVWPTHEIDHINGVRTDNRIVNLRDVPHMVNAQNIKGPFRNNTIGVIGVVRDHGRYSARISIAGKSKHIGMFGTAEEAHNAYLSAKRQLHKGNTL